MMPRWVAALFRFVALPGRSEDAVGDLVEMRGRWVERWGRLLGGLLASVAALDIACSLLRQRMRRRKGASLADTQHAEARRIRDFAPGPSRVVEAWIRDFALAGRSLRRAPGFTVVVVLTLSCAIGINTVIFSVVDAVLLDPLGYPAADRLVSIRASAPGTDRPAEFGPAPEFYLQYRDNADMLEDIGMYLAGQATLRSDTQVERLFMTQATPDVFTTLGARVQVGRLLVPEDDPTSVMLLSDWVWRTWFGADPAVVGRSYEALGAMRQVIGVMEPGFRFPDVRTAVWVHLRIDHDVEFNPGSWGFNLVGRVRPGVQPDDLELQLEALARRLPELYGGSPGYARIIEQHRPIVRTLEEELVGDMSRPLWLVMATVGTVLLIACANVANLFSVRLEGKRRSLNARYALGASRGDLVRAQMTEALLLALLGGLGGVILAWGGLPLVVGVAPDTIANLELASLSVTALIFTGGVTFLVALAFGLGPALQFSRPRVMEWLRQSGSATVRRTVGRDALVLVQTAGALVLLVGAGLLLRSFWTLSHVDPGYDTKGVFTFQTAPDRDVPWDGLAWARFHNGFLERIASLPSVEHVGLVSMLPLDEGAATMRMHTEASLLAGDRAPLMNFAWVGGEYFRTMGIEVQEGRPFEPSDHDVGPVNLIVSRTAADQYWPTEDALGQRLRLSTTAWATVVGIVEDIRLVDFRQDAPDPMVYFPLVGLEARTWVVRSPAYVVRSNRADLIEPEIRALVAEYMPGAPVYRIFTMEALADRSMARLSFTMMMLAIAAVLALVLGAVGLYGLLSYVVSNRSREIAVRMALGAEAGTVQRMVVAEGVRLTVGGVILGLIAAVLLTRVLDSLLFGVGSLDIPTFLAMSALMVGVAILASYAPARRASEADPVQILRAG